MTKNKVEAEYLEIINKNAWPLIYQKIGQDSQGNQGTCDEAKKPQNKPFNRYRDVNPYDHTRIVLNRSDTDYINANLVKLDRANRKYVLTQGPLMATVDHFWCMVWEQSSRAILMLNKLVEKSEIKCHWYWPKGNGEEHKMYFDNRKLSVVQINESDFGYYHVRNFRMTDTQTDETREVIQFHYTTWPDFGVPTSPVQFIDFLMKVRASGVLESDVGPPIVHCSAGIGRSGTFCLVDACLVIIENEGGNALEIPDVLLDLRKDRMGLIQTSEQLRFSYTAILEGAQRLDPDWEKNPTINEGFYAAVAEDEAPPPPPPPPRGESLSKAPARPLPAIPSSTSLDDLMYANSDSSSDESQPASPALEFVGPASSADDEDDEPMPELNDIELESSEIARRRRTRDRELAERVSNMKRRARESERWHSLKRSLMKPLLSLTFGVIVAGFAIYSYAKH